MTRMLACLIALVALLVNQPVHADCTVTTSTANLGSLSSFVVASTPNIVQTGTGFKCTGSVLSLISTNTIDMRIASSANGQGTVPRLHNAQTGAYLPYSICQDTSCNTVYNVGSTIQWRQNTFLDILGLFSAPDGTLPLYLRPATGIQLPKGTYTDMITMDWSWRLCTLGALGICVYDTGTATGFLHVTLEVLNDCFIDTAPDVSFGSAALVSAFESVTQGVGVRCTPQATYSVAFDMGNNAAGGWRRMLKGVDALQYNFYKPSDSTVWNTSNPVSMTGDGNTQSVPYRVTINPTQGNVPAGTYTDTVRVIVSY